MNRLLFCSEINFNYILNKQQAFVLLLEVWGWSFTVLHWMNNYALSYSGKGKIKSPSTREQYLCTRRKKATHPAAPYLFIEWDDVTQEFVDLVLSRIGSCGQMTESYQCLGAVLESPLKNTKPPAQVGSAEESSFSCKKANSAYICGTIPSNFYQSIKEILSTFSFICWLKNKNKNVSFRDVRTGWDRLL